MAHAYSQPVILACRGILRGTFGVPQNDREGDRGFFGTPAAPLRITAGSPPPSYLTVKVTEPVSRPALFIRKSYDPGFSGALNSNVPEVIPEM
jgi:hypothetical protein